MTGQICGDFDDYNQARECALLPLKLKVKSPVSAISKISLEISYDDGNTLEQTITPRVRTDQALLTL